MTLHTEIVLVAISSEIAGRNNSKLITVAVSSECVVDKLHNNHLQGKRYFK